MKKPRRIRSDAGTPIDRFIRAYLELAPCEIPLAMAALRGAELARGKMARTNGADSTPAAQAAFEEMGAAAEGATEWRQKNR